MSKSSCPKGSIDPKELARQKVMREEDMLVKARNFLKRVALNLCLPEGVSGKVDIALGIRRKEVVIKALRQTADDLESK